MENEELAALRATLLAAQRQPLAVKVRQARLSALLSDGDELLPYMLSRSCSDPRDRAVEREEIQQLRILEGGADAPRVARLRRSSGVQLAHEPIPTRPSRLAAVLAMLIVLCLLSQMLGMVLIHWR